MKTTTIILTPEQKALHEKNVRLGEEGQAAAYSKAISRALNHANEDVAMEGGTPSLTAVLTALAGGAAYYICQAPDADDREKLIGELLNSIERQVEEVTAMQTKRQQGRD